ncbi:uncharacterized protein KZ484_021857 [Pholidichthys leucotaenia]
MVCRCVVYGCDSVPEEHVVSVFEFPVPGKFRKAWVKFVQKTRKHWNDVGRTPYMCSRHFVDSDFKNKMQCEMKFAKRLLIKKTAIPTIYPSIPKSDSKTSGRGVKSQGDLPMRSAVRKREVNRILSAVTQPSNSVDVSDQAEEADEQDFDVNPISDPLDHVPPTLNPAQPTSDPLLPTPNPDLKAEPSQQPKYKDASATYDPPAPERLQPMTQTRKFIVRPEKKPVKQLKEERICQEQDQNFCDQENLQSLQIKEEQEKLHIKPLNIKKEQEEVHVVLADIKKEEEELNPESGDVITWSESKESFSTWQGSASLSMKPPDSPASVGAPELESTPMPATSPAPSTSGTTCSSAAKRKRSHPTTDLATVFSQMHGDEIRQFQHHLQHMKEVAADAREAREQEDAFRREEMAQTAAFNQAFLAEFGRLVDALSGRHV